MENLTAIVSSRRADMINGLMSRRVGYFASAQNTTNASFIRSKETSA